MDTLLQDLRYAVRSLRKSPGFTVVAVVTLALGIGATTAIFSVLHAVLLRPLPYQAPDRLVKVWEVSPQSDARNVVSSGNYLAWRENADSFEELGAHSWRFGLALTGSGQPKRVNAVRMTPAALRVLGVQPLRGRTFTPEEAEPGGPAVALVSHSLWQQRFGGENVVGSTMTLNDEAFTIVGVMPPNFDYPDPEVEVWYPLRFDTDDRDVRESHQWNVIGRLRPGASIESAQAEMDAVAAGIRSQHPEYMTGWGVNVTPLRTDIVGDAGTLLLVLFGVVVLVLLVACANLANLLLARGLAREHEIAIRGAVGASRGRLVRQLLTESGLLALLGGVLALATVWLVLDTLIALAPPDIPLLDDVRMSPAVLMFAAGATILVGLLFGLLPALRLTQEALRASLASRAASDATRHARLRAALIIAEVALSLVLLVGAGLLVRSFVRLNAVDYGFEPSGVLTVGLDLPSSRYDTHEAQVAFYERLLERVRELPGVAAAAATNEPPIIGYQMSFSFEILGRPAGTASGKEDDAVLHAVLPGYFRTLRIPLLHGRTLDESDRADAPPVLVINEALARKHWPGGNPIGERVGFDDEGPWFEIVGVVGDTRHSGLDRPAQPALYIAYAQKPWTWMSWQTLVVRADARQDPGALTPAIRSAITELDPGLPLQRVATLTDLYTEGNARRRFAMLLMGAFAGLALLLGSVGLYGVLSYSVAQRRREIGIRIALGAAQNEVLRLVLIRGLALSLLGIGIGLVGALAVSRLLSSLLYGVSATDPATFVGVTLFLGTVALVACYIPARRATRVDPMVALRAE